MRTETITWVTFAMSGLASACTRPVPAPAPNPVVSVAVDVIEVVDAVAPVARCEARRAPVGAAVLLPQQLWVGYTSDTPNAPVDVWNLSSGALARTLDAGLPFTRWIERSPNGEHIATVGDPTTGEGALRVWNAASFAQTGPFEVYGLTAMEFSRDGSRLLLAGSHGQLSVWDVPGARLVASAPIADMRAAAAVDVSVAWNPNGRQFAYADATGLVELWSVQPMRRERVLQVAAEAHAGPNAPSLAWSADGRSLASSDRSHWVALWSVTGGARRVLYEERTRSERDEVNDVAWNPSANALAFLPPGGAPTIRSFPGAMTAGATVQSALLAWNHDGTLLAAATAQCGLLLLDRTGSERGRIAGTESQREGARCFLQWAPGRNELALVNDGGALRVIDASGATPTVRYTHPAWIGIDAARPLRWSNDGAFVLEAGAGVRVLRVRDGATLVLAQWMQSDRVGWLAEQESGAWDGTMSATQCSAFERTTGERVRREGLLRAFFAATSTQ